MKKQNKTLATVPGQQTTCRPSGWLRRTSERRCYYVILCATSTSFGSSRQLICFCASAPPIRTSDVSHASQPKLFQNVVETAEFECSATTEMYFTTKGQFDRLRQRSLITVLFHGTGSSGSDKGKWICPGPEFGFLSIFARFWSSVLQVFLCNVWLMVKCVTTNLEKYTPYTPSNFWHSTTF